MALDRGLVTVAEDLVAGLDDPPDGLRERVLHARRLDDERQARSVQMRIDADRSVGLLFRRYFVLGLGVLFVGAFATVAIWPPENAWWLFGGTHVFFGIGSVVMSFWRRTMLGNRLNRSIVILSLITWVAIASWFACAELLGVTMHVTYVVFMLVMALVNAAGVAAIDARGLMNALVWLLAAFTAAVWPPWVFTILVVAAVSQIAGMTAMNFLVARYRPNDSLEG